jgi:hypothetical protein
MANDILIGFVLDSSGSMSHLHGATLRGFNQILDEQKQEEGRCLLSLTKFSTNFDVAYVARDIQEVEPLGSPGNPYRAGGGTALYDAVGTTVKGIEAWLDNHKDFAGDVKIIILTDGEENSSKEWHIYENAPVEDDRDINNLINYKQNEGWEFVFLGTGKSAWLESQRFTAVPSSSTYAFAATSSSNESTYAGVSRGLRASRLVGGTVTSNLAQDEAFNSVVVNRGDEDKLDDPTD